MYKSDSELNMKMPPLPENIWDGLFTTEFIHWWDINLEALDLWCFRNE